MAKINNRKSEARTAIVARFSLGGLVVFGLLLALAGGLLTAGLMTVYAKSTFGKDLRLGTGASGTAEKSPPWGDLIESEIDVERPGEFAATEVNTNRVPIWIFAKMSPGQARALMVSCGLTAAQVESAMSPGHSSVNGADTVVRPDDELVLSLTPEVRAKLYNELGAWEANHYMHFPFCFPKEKVGEWLEGSGLSPGLIARITNLMYLRGEKMCFSDLELAARSLTSETERVAMVKALSRQPAILVRVHIGPQTDVDRMLNYWKRGLQVSDARPLLESIKRLDDGGNISLLYLLPRFARERLYTYPPAAKSDIPMDCHWTSLNFFNETPDNRFGDAAYTARYLTDNFYLVPKADHYGDIVLVLNKEGNAIHSVVYLADDIVFTKNGNNYTQPWMLMRLKDVLSDYSGASPARTIVYRSKNS
jgi:hypothetical protein